MTEENEIIIRIAEPSDTQSLHELLHYWYTNYFTKEDPAGHMFSKITWGLEDIERVIADNMATVAVHGAKVVSFYFINTFFEIGNVEERISILKPMIAEGKLPQGRYAFSLAAATHRDYLAKGLNRATLNLLRELVKDKYDYFTGIMAYDNLVTQKSSLKMGWRHIGDIGIGLLAVIGTTEENNDLLDKHLVK